MPARLLIGTCNWADHQEFYPPELERGRRTQEKLPWYARLFPIVEVDSSFYGIPRPATTERWAQETPAGFVFNVKAFRTLTGHGLPGARRAPASAEHVEEFEAALAPLREAGKLGAIHYQFPPWATFEHARNRRAILDAAARHPGDIVAIEFRHVSWFCEENLPATEELVRRAGAALVCVDAPQRGRGTAPPLAVVTTPRLAVVRFHGRNADTWYRRGGSSRERFDHYYTPAELREWSGGITAMAAQAEEVHLLMNTNNRNQGPVNAYRLAAVLGVELPAPPESIAATIAAA